MILTENQTLEWKEKIEGLSPKIKEMFFKYNGAILALGEELFKRDLKFKVSPPKTPKS